MNRIILPLVALLALLPLGATTVQAQTDWSLDRCVQYALDNNLSVQRAQQNIANAEASVRQARAALFPSLTFNTTQQMGFQKVETQSYTTIDARTKNPTYSGTYNLNASVTLFDGGSNWRTLQQNKVTREAERLNAEVTENSIESQIIEAYYKILYAHESVSTNQAVVELAERELARTEALLALGKGTKVDVAQMESQLQQNRYQLVTAQNTEAQNILALKQLLMLDPSEPFNIDYIGYDSDEVMAPLPSLADAEQMALAHLPNMRQAQLNVRSAELSTSIAKGGYWPTLSLNAGISSGNGNTYKGGFISQITDHMRENVGVTLSMPILDNRRTRTLVDKAKIQHSNALIDLEDTRLNVQNTIAKLHLDTMSAQARYQSAVANETSARQSFEMMEERHQVGLSTVVELLTQKNQYLQAVQETLQSKYTALLNLRMLRFYTGTEK